MKKFGIGSRLLAALLALTMMMSILPISVFAADGDLKNGETGLDGNINTLDTISWPIKVYDYLNDGLLFEYASAQDKSMSNLGGDAYGGGAKMPGDISYGGNILGSDFTVISSEYRTYYNGAYYGGAYYDSSSYSHWLKAKSNYDSSYARQGNGTPGAFKFLRLQPWLTKTDMPAMPISDFDNNYNFYLSGTASYPRDRVRYAVLVYKTNVDNLELTMGLATNLNGAYTVRDYNGNYTVGPDGYYVSFDLVTSKYLKASDSWNYIVVDMNAGPVGDRWDSITNVYQIILDNNMTDSSQYLDLSHIAYFSSAEEAARFGEAAKAFSNNPGEYLPDQYYTLNGTTYSKHWNMGNNTAFTMLRGSNGGGWSGNGGDNDLPNGYYSYYIGVDTTSDTSTANNRRNNAPDGYPVPDDIFYYSVGVDKTKDLSQYDFGYTLYNMITAKDFGQVMTAGLLQNDLISIKGVDGKIYRIPQYKQSAVEYIALLLRQTLPIGQQDPYGNYNYNFVQGSVSSQFADANGNKRDLATALREVLKLEAPTNGLGNYTYASTVIGSYDNTIKNANQLIGPYQQVKGNIKTFHDAAYYLMHNLFVDDSYNQLQDDYNYLVLSKANVSGEEAFVFDAGFTTGNIESDPNSKSAVVYNKNNGTISLSSALGKDEISYSGGQWTTRNPFLPVTDAEGDYGCTGTPYFREDGARTYVDYGDTYINRNYNYVMQANAEFVYHYQDDLFFQFEGDDDVYLFVNGELVLDIGAAHSITSVKMQMNNYVLQAQKELSFLKQNYGYRPDMSDSAFEELLKTAKKDGVALTEEQKDAYRRWHHLNLVDGNTYSIDFYYMERHGWGANMRVATNILMTDPALDTEKKAYQDGAEISYGGIVDPNEHIAYSFSLTNKGNGKLYNLTFNDYDIGLTLSPKTGLTFNKDNINGVTVTDGRGQTLEASDLIVSVDGYMDEEKTQPVHVDVRFDGQNPNEELKQFLTDLTSNDGTDDEDTDDLFAGKGLWRHATVTIRGMYYNLTSEQIADEQFNNTLFTTANPAVDSDLVLNSADIHQVRLIGDARHIYQWREHDVHFTREDLVKWLGGNVQIGNKTFSASQIKMTTCRKDGTSFDFPDIIVRDYSSMTVNYWKSGTQLFFIKVYTDTNNDQIPDDLNGDGVLDENDYMIVPLAVFVTDLQDDVVVLDYGLEAELTGKNGIVTNDYITVPNLDTNYSIMGMSKTAPSYLNDTSNLTVKNYNRISFAPLAGNTVKFNDGEYEYTEYNSNDQLSFTPTDFMDEEYVVYMAVTIHEADKVASPVGVANGNSANYTIDITKEVQMYQKVTVLPATVMYYEDDFAGIKLESGITTNVTGTGSDVLMQGVDQSVNYGTDQVYQTKDNAQISGNSMTAIRVTEHGKLAQFTFTGTGFEIVGRTNAFDAGSFMIHVKDGKQTGELVMKPAVGLSEMNNLYRVNSNAVSTYIPGSRTIYLDLAGVKSGTWKTPYANYPDSSGITKMQKVSASRYSIHVPYFTESITFTDGDDETLKVTQDLAYDVDVYSVSNDSWSASKSTRTIYVETDGTWHRPYAYFWNENNRNMVMQPGATSSPYLDNVFAVEVPPEATGIMFTNVLRTVPVITEFSNKAGAACKHTDRTEQQPLPADQSNMFNGYEWTFDSRESNGEGRTIYFDNSITNWEKVYAYTYKPKAGSETEKVALNDPWPGVAMTDEGDNIYSVVVADEATEIVFNGINHNTSGHCTTCGAYVGHAYYNDLCPCGKERLDYYLIGYINGADYGCEADWENMGQYKFENGKLTATFRMDSYVFVKTTGNESFFMTDGYPGANVRSAYLYNTNSPGLQADKLHVPGGVELTFTLMEHGDGSMMLSYTTADDDVTDLDKTVYFNNTGDWSKVSAYYWSFADDYMIKWPGVPMTKTDEDDSVYRITLPSDAEYVIFNDGTDTGAKTQDLTVPADNMIYNDSGFNKGWSVYNPGKTTLNFDNSASKWGKVYIYYWSEQDEQMIAWPGEEMTPGSDDVFTAAIPSHASKVLFHNGDGTQTSDLDILKNGDIYIYGKGWASSESADSDRIVYFKNTDKWSNLHVHYWDAVNGGNLVSWPGDAMVQQSGDVYKASIPATATHVIFNNGNGGGKQTLDLELDEQLNLFVYDKVAADTTPVGSWSVYGDNTDQTPEVPTAKTIYLINNGNWPIPCAYYWGGTGAGTSWPGVQMTHVEGNRYSVTVPLDTQFIIFNNNDSGIQTSDMTLVEGMDVFDFNGNYWSSTDPVNRTIYLDNNTGWSTPYAYFWMGDTNLSAWPGVPMTQVSGDRYRIEIPALATQIIFNNGNGGEGNQTGDLNLAAGQDLYNLSTGTWSSSGIIQEDTTPKTIYYDNSNNWTKVYVYYWSASNDGMVVWPGMEMAQVEGSIYTVDIPGNAQYVIFNSGEGDQTGNLTLPTSEGNFYSIPDKSCGSWQTYEPQRVLYFDVGDAGWTTVNAYYWSDQENPVTWPGVAMELHKGTVYKITVPASAAKVIFNDGSNQTADLSIAEAYDKYSYNTGEWSSTTRVIYFEGTGTGSVRLRYSSDTDPVGGSAIMTRIKNSIYSYEIPVDAKYVTFEDGNTKIGPVVLSDDHDLYSAQGRDVFDPVADYRRVVYFENTKGWENVYVHYWGEGINATTWPGRAMTFVDNRIYTATIPAGAAGLIFSNGNTGPENQTENLTLPKVSNLFTINAGDDKGTWSQYVKSKIDAIHQVPTLRVDGLALGTYTVEIQGIPTYTPDVIWTNKENYIKTTYLYLDGIRIYRPLGKTNGQYAVTENGAEFKELRDLILAGKAAVAAYKHGTTAYTGNVSWTENRNGTGGDMKTVYVGNQLSGIDDYLLLGPNNETYLNGNAQTQAVIFYVKESEGQQHHLQIGARGIDAGLFMDGNSTGVNATLYYGVVMKKPDGSQGYGWRPLDTLLSSTEQYYTVDYRDCPYTVDENGVKTYQVALFVRSGMVSFTNVKYIGLDIASKTIGDATDLQLHNGTIYVDDEKDGTIGGGKTEATTVQTNLVSISAQMEAFEWIEDVQQSITLKYPALSFEDEVFYNIFFTTDNLEGEPVEMGLLMFDALEENGTIYDASAVIPGVTAVDGMYIARSQGVQAKDLGKTLYFRVYAQMADGRYVYSKAASYSARQYAKAILEGNYNTETKALVAAMLKYSEAAQNYFGSMETVSDLLNDRVNSLVSDYRTDLINGVVKPDATKAGCFAATATGFARKSPAVSFDGAFAIHYFFTPSTTVQGNMTLYYWNTEDYAGATELTADNATGSMIMAPGTQYTAAITGIAAKDIDSTYYVAVVYQSNGQTYCSGVLAYSLAAYCQSMANAEGAISDLAKATAVYGYHAKQLFG